MNEGLGGKCSECGIEVKQLYHGEDNFSVIKGRVCWNCLHNNDGTPEGEGIITFENNNGRIPMVGSIAEAKVRAIFDSMISHASECRCEEFKGTANNVVIDGICDYCEKEPAREVYDDMLLCVRCYDRIMELHTEK